MAKCRKENSKSIKKDVFINLPEEFRENNIAWQLRNCAYEFNDLSCTWYLRVCNSLKSTSNTMVIWSSIILMPLKKSLKCSVVINYVSWGGISSFQNIDPFKQMLEISRESCSMFKYLSLHNTAKRGLQNN